MTASEKGCSTATSSADVARLRGPLGIGALLRRSAGLVAGQAGTWALAMVWIAVVPRRLGTADYGRFVFASSVLAIATALGGLGLEVHIGRSVARRRDDPSISSAIALGTGLLVGSCLVAAALSLPGGGAVVPGLTLGFLLQGAGNLAFGALQGLERPGIRAAADVVAKSVFTLGSIVAVAGGAGLGAIGGAWAAGYAIYATVAAIALSKAGISHARPQRSALGPILRETAPIGGHLAAQALYYRADSAMLSPLRGAAETGVYGAAYRIFDSASFVTTIYGAVVSPRLMRAAHEDRAALVPLVRSGVLAMAGLGAAVSVLLAGAAPPLLRLLYGEAFDSATTPLRLLAAALFLSFPVTPIAWALVAVDGQRLLARVSVGAAVFNVALNLLAIPRYGASGAAATTVLTELIVLGGSWAALRTALAVPNRA